MEHLQTQKISVRYEKVRYGGARYGGLPVDHIITPTNMAVNAYVLCASIADHLPTLCTWKTRTHTTQEKVTFTQKTDINKVKEKELTKL